MVCIFFTGSNRRGELEKSIVGGPSIEFCFEVLTTLVQAGCRLVDVQLCVGDDRKTDLPIDAFDGQPMQDGLQALQQEWEEILFENK